MGLLGFVTGGGLALRPARRRAVQCTCARSDGVVEVYSNKSVRYGLVIGRAERTVRVWLEDDATEVTVSNDQVHHLESLSPGVAERPLLATIATEARAFLAKAPPRALELEPAYNAMREQKAGMVWSTEQAAEALANTKFGVPPAAWVMVVGWLLAADSFRFKRAVGGGWKVRPPSVVESLQIDAFADKVAQGTDRVKRWTKLEVQLIRSLELLAAAGGTRTPSSKDKKVLSKLSVEASSGGAQKVLRDLGLWAETAANTTKPSTPLEAPFPTPVTKEARAIRARSLKRRTGLVTGGTSIPVWRKDLRKVRAYCVDAKGTRFLDDAFSLQEISPDLIELTVYIADMDELLSVGSQMDKLALERGESIYLPTRPLHMLPPAVLEAASLQPTLPSEVIAARVVIDVKSAHITEKSVFGAVIGPVIPLDTVHFATQLEDDPEQWQSLRAIEPFLVGRTVRNPKRLDPTANVSQVKQVGTRTTIQGFQDSSGHRIIDAILRLAGNTFREFAREKKAALPERKNASSFALRCGTAPLRRYSDLLVQRQLKRVLTGGQKIAPQNIWRVGLDLERKHTAATKYLANTRQDLLLQSLSDHIAVQERSASESASLSAQVRWIGRKMVGVAVIGTGLEATVARPPSFELKVGERIDINVTSIDIRSRVIKAEVC